MEKPQSFSVSFHVETKEVKKVTEAEIHRRLKQLFTAYGRSVGVDIKIIDVIENKLKSRS